MYIKKYPKKSKGRAYEDTLEGLVDEINYGENDSGIN